MSKIKKVVKSVTGALGLGGSQSAPSVVLPPAQIPAVAAPPVATDTGATVIIGSDNVDDTRIGSSRRATKRQIDTLGGLGVGGGLKI